MEFKVYLTAEIDVDNIEEDLQYETAINILNLCLDRFESDDRVVITEEEIK